MDFSGDTQLYPAIKLDTTIYVDSNGEISEEETETCIKKVIRVINGSIDDVSHLIGHSEKDTTELLIDKELLQSTPEVTSKLKDVLRIPASYLVLEENGQLYGVIVDSNGELNIVGVVEHVIPGEQNDNYCKVAVLPKNDSIKFCKPSDIDIRAKIETGSVFGLVSLGGYVFLPINVRSYPEMPDLVLILQNGYFIIEDDKVKWTRLKVGLRKDEIETKTTEIEKGESIVTSCGGCVRTSDGFEIFGSQTAIFAFTALLDFLVSMQTIGFEKESYSQQNATELAEQKHEEEEDEEENEEENEDDYERYEDEYENEDIEQQSGDLEKEAQSVESYNSYAQLNEEQYETECTQMAGMYDMNSLEIDDISAHRESEDKVEQEDVGEENEHIMSKD